jgi:magnesium chelatase family protein
MLGIMDCAVLDGFGAKKIRVEVDIARGLPNFTLVGLAENSVKESRVRVQAAISNAGFDFPKARISVNLAPADVQKSGTAFDLSIALAILLASGVIPEPKMAGIAAIGELSLTGEIRPVRGMLALAESIRAQGFTYLLKCARSGTYHRLNDQNRQ